MGGYIYLGSQLVGGAVSANSSYMSGKAQQGYYNAVARMNEQQARNEVLSADREIRYDLETAALQSARISEAGGRAYGSQKAAMAAAGMDLSSGSALNAAASSAHSEAQDKALLQYQASRSAYEKRLQAQLNAIGLQSQASQNRLAGKNARYAGQAQTGGTLLTTAGSVGAQWYQYAQNRALSKTLNAREQTMLADWNNNKNYRMW